MKTKLERRIEQLDRKYGSGETYSRRERELILGDIVPEWLLRASKVCSGDMRERAAQLVAMLERAHKAVRHLVMDRPEEEG